MGADVRSGDVPPDVPSNSTAAHAGHPNAAVAPAHLSWAQALDVARGDAEPSFERSGVVRRSLLVVGTLLLAGIVAGVLWALLAEPPGYTVNADGASMGETAAGAQFGVEVLYAGLALAFGLLLGVLTGLRLPQYGWVIAVALVIGSLGAAFLSYAVGRWLGPPDPSQSVTGAPVGAVVPIQLDVAARGVLLVWPVAALVGLLVALALSGRHTPYPRPLSATLPHRDRTDTIRR